ncbi:MAG TPA: hypothetical protein VHK88_12195, partial [Aquihabitans sp.]|nr:hypothetical protein [Aquihabitans sp.]
HLDRHRHRDRHDGPRLLMALERLATVSSGALAVLLAGEVGGDRPPYLRIVLVAVTVLAALGAWEVRRGDLLGWSLPVGAACTTVAGVAVVHAWGLPGVSADGWTAATIAAGLLAASVLVAAVARRLGPWSRHRSAPLPRT